MHLIKLKRETRVEEKNIREQKNWDVSQYSMEVHTDWRLAMLSVSCRFVHSLALLWSVYDVQIYWAYTPLNIKVGKIWLEDLDHFGLKASFRRSSNWRNRIPLAPKKKHVISNQLLGFSIHSRFLPTRLSCGLVSGLMWSNIRQSKSSATWRDDSESVAVGCRQKKRKTNKFLQSWWSY